MITKYITKNFKSSISRDYIVVKYPRKFHGSHKAKFTINVYDNMNENKKLVNNVIEYSNINNIQWLYFTVHGRCTIPQNALVDTNKKSNNIISCHIADFAKFYMKNMDKIIFPKHIYVPKSKKKNKKGWTIVVNRSKLQDNKMIQIKKNMAILNYDWAKICEI
uniref:Uncharacterized protein n=1 Tax=Mimivirus LCMiAC01 TaxID=2506608 RepID=A0A481Z0Y2_9VIRU|nr:MAG: hypothetical protein LCMiAC01_05030 [Mimivirus LCMiAC01]